MANDIDHRTRSRALVQQTISVYDVFKQLKVGRLVNIHEEGLMVIGSAELREECIYQMELQLSKPIESKEKIPLGAECLWTKKTDTEEQYWAGLFIVDIAEQDLHIIRLLASL